MFRILENKRGALEHFRDYAEKVRRSVEIYMVKKSDVLKTTYTESFLMDIVSSNTMNPNTNSLLGILLIGDFESQKCLIRTVDSNLAKEHNKDSYKLFIDTLNELFVKQFYEKNSFFSKTAHIERVNIDVCPYCGRNYIFVVKKPTKSNPNTVVKPQIDHFLPKDSYPYLAMNYYNLIPSCTSCNLNPCKWTNDPIGIERSHEYLMQPYEFRTEDIHFSFKPGTTFYYNSSVGVFMTCNNPEHEVGYKQWLVLDKLYAKHNTVVSRMFVQLESIVSIRYHECLKNKFRIPVSFLEKMPMILFGYNLDDNQAPYITLHKFKKDIYNQIIDELNAIVDV